MELEKLEQLDHLADDLNEKYNKISSYGASEDIQLTEIYDDSFKNFERFAQNIAAKDHIPVTFQNLPVFAQNSLHRSNVVNKSIIDEYIARAFLFVNTVFVEAEHLKVIPSSKEKLSNTDILIIAPLEEEIDEFKGVFSCNDRAHRKGNSKLFFSEVNGKKVTILQPNNMGQTDATAAAANIIESAKPSFVFVSGIAAGFDKDPQRLGDILIPESILQYDRIRKVQDVINENTGKSTTETKTSSKQYPVSDELFKSLEDFVKHSESYKDWINENTIENENCSDFSTIPKAFLGETMASADEVQSSEKRIKELSKTNRKIIGQDMESAGVIVASTYSDYNPKVITVRGISDWGAGKESLESETSGEVRAQTARRTASFIKKYLESTDFDNI